MTFEILIIISLFYIGLSLSLCYCIILVLFLLKKEKLFDTILKKVIIFIFSLLFVLLVLSIIKQLD